VPGSRFGVNPYSEFFGLDDVMPGNQNERVPRENARIPNVRNWAMRDYGNRIGIWRIIEVLTRYGIRASAALNSEACDHHPEIIEEAGRLRWELIGHDQTNALRLTEMDEAAERDAVRATIDRIKAACGRRPVGWLGAGLAETWNTLDYLAEAGIRYVSDWVNDDQPYLFEIGNPPLVSLPYSVQTNDVPAYFEMKVSVPEARINPVDVDTAAFALRGREGADIGEQRRRGAGSRLRYGMPCAVPPGPPRRWRPPPEAPCAGRSACL
jgi:allantoinase